MPCGDAPGLTSCRTALDRSRRRHMLHLQAAIATGLPACELAHGEQVHAASISRLLTACRDPRGCAPMLLRPEAQHGR